MHQSTRSRAITTTGVAIVMVVVTAVAAVASGDFGRSAKVTSGKLHACVVSAKADKSNAGLLRYIGSHAKCPSHETKLTWNARGPRGKRGKTGPRGLQGIQGNPGTPASTTFTGRILGITGNGFGAISGLSTLSDSGDFGMATANTDGYLKNLLVKMTGPAPTGGTHFYIVDSNLTVYLDCNIPAGDTMCTDPNTSGIVPAGTILKVKLSTGASSGAVLFGVNLTGSPT
jgi:hypothetical protein